MTIFGLTEKGPVRAVNQDCFESVYLPSPPRIKGSHNRAREALLAVVCDGMGGARAGDLASRLATDAFVEKMKEKTSREACEALKNALSHANSAVYGRAEGEASLRGMGSTLISALAYEDTLALLSVGDSRAYLWHEGHLLLLTHDHTYVQGMIDAGKMSPEEARKSPCRNLITRAVGTRPSVEGDALYCAWEEGDRLLLCTDGLSTLTEGELAMALSLDASPREIAEKLIDMAIMRGSEDNLTALLIENAKENP